MKMISMIVTVLGVIALILAFVDKLTGTAVVGVSAGGYLRGATALYLLALAVMCHCKFYCTKPPA